MKKLLLILASTPAILLCMEKPAENMLKFITMEQQHKQDWFDYKKSIMDEEITLMKSQMNAMFDLKKQHIQQAAKGGNMETFMQDHLMNMVKLHEEQNKEWKEMCESQYKKGAEIGKAHATELTKFKKSIMPETELSKEEKIEQNENVTQEGQQEDQQEEITQEQEEEVKE